MSEHTAAQDDSTGPSAGRARRLRFTVRAVTGLVVLGGIAAFVALAIVLHT